MINDIWVLRAEIEELHRERDETSLDVIWLRRKFLRDLKQERQAGLDEGAAKVVAAVKELHRMIPIYGHAEDCGDESHDESHLHFESIDGDYLCQEDYLYSACEACKEDDRYVEGVCATRAAVEEAAGVANTQTNTRDEE